MAFVVNYSINAPAGGSESNASESIKPIIQGRLKEVKIIFPSGCADLTTNEELVHVQLFWRGRQILPDQGATITGTDEPLVFNPDILIFSNPHNLKVKVWNTDTKYAHRIKVRLVIEPFGMRAL